MLGIITFACVRALGASGASADVTHPVAARLAATKTAATVEGATTAMYSLTAGGLERTYEVITPDKKLPAAAPVIVMLSGINSTVASEIGRDRLINYAIADKAEIVYPVAYDESWNAIGCCGQAAAKNVNDLAFLKAVVATVDPSHARPVYLVGYSNGARMAFRVACDDPTLFDGYAMVKGGPTADCEMRTPVNIIEMASVNDPEVPYQLGDKGSTGEEPVTVLVSQLHAEEKCPAADTVTHSGTMTQTTWSGCADGTRFALAAWSGGVHSFPRPPASVPAAAQVLWSFFTKTPLAPLPA